MNVLRSICSSDELTTVHYAMARCVMLTDNVSYSHVFESGICEQHDLMIKAHNKNSSDLSLI